MKNRKINDKINNQYKDASTYESRCKKPCLRIFDKVGQKQYVLPQTIDRCTNYRIKKKQAHLILPLSVSGHG